VAPFRYWADTQLNWPFQQGLHRLFANLCPHAPSNTAFLQTHGVLPDPLIVLIAHDDQYKHERTRSR
jgi:hypothetical protein